MDHNYFKFDAHELPRMQRLEGFAEWVAGQDLTDFQATDHHVRCSRARST